jgi:hypothetical protein
LGLTALCAQNEVIKGEKIMANKVYAYVRSETCNTRKAVRPGSTVGRNEEPVSKSDDWKPWPFGKRETLAIIARGGADASRYYMYQCAQLVADLRDWAY